MHILLATYTIILYSSSSSSFISSSLPLCVTFLALLLTDLTARSYDYTHETHSVHIYVHVNDTTKTHQFGQLTLHSKKTRPGSENNDGLARCVLLGVATGQLRSLVGGGLIHFHRMLDVPSSWPVRADFLTANATCPCHSPRSGRQYTATAVHATMGWHGHPDEHPLQFVHSGSGLFVNVAFD